ncbi:MAG: nitroreductase family deazaflavin-dependent oxidoreductase [Chloroflexi bacterium]|nr:nitroreductase family deazaflavin-dependent oxidoreductase [Chloroflexota bacterium]
MVDFDELAAEQYCYLTTIGRATGRPHEIEIWFGMKVLPAGATRSGRREAGHTTVYMLSGGRDRSDWVRNLTKKPTVTVRIGDWQFDGLARKVAPATEEDRDARRLLLDKYSQASGDDLTEWGKSALPIAIELTIDGARATPRSR